MRKFTADFETTVSETDCRVWAYSICEIGNVSKTKVDVVYMEGIADKDILDKVVKQIKNIDKQEQKYLARKITIKGQTTNDKI